MAKHTLYSNIMKVIADQGFDWTSNTTIKCALLHTATWNQTHTLWSDVSASEVTGTAYVAGGQVLLTAANSTALVGRVTQFKSTHNPLWEVSTIAATHAVLYIDGTTKYLISMIDFEGEQSSVAGDFQISWTDAIVFTTTVAEKTV